MNVLTTTWHQLVRRRLWPVAVLLVAALAAVPVLLSRNASPVPPPESTSSAPAENAKTDDALATPVVAKASTADRSRRRRVLGARKDPFTPEAIKHPKKVKKTKVVVKKTQPKQDTSSPPASPSSPAPSTPVTTPVVTTPAPKKKTYAKGSLIVRFGDAEAESLKRINVKKLGPLPDDTDPLLVYMGLTDHGKKAVFMVDASLEPTGDGDCRPHPSNCETIELAVGETEFFDASDEETGDVTTHYELDLVDIK